MKLYIITNLLIRVLVLVLGTGQAAFGSPIVLDFAIQEPAIETSTPAPIQEIEKPKNIIQKLSAAELFATRQSPGSIAVGAAEGNLTPAGKATSLYLGHIDPGNHVTNRGFCSWNRALNLTVAEADRRCLAALQSQSAAVERKLSDLGIDVKVDIEALVNGADIWNQSNFAGRQFAAKYKKALEKGLRGERAVLDARVEAFRNEVGQLDASGLFGICLRQPYYRQQLAGLTAYSESWRWQCIALDQGRRVGEVGDALKLHLGNIASGKVKTVDKLIPSKPALKDEPVSTPQAQPRLESMVLSFEPALDRGSAPARLPDSDSIDVSLLVSTSANIEDKSRLDLSVQNAVLPSPSEPASLQALTLSFEPAPVPAAPLKPKVVEIASAKADLQLPVWDKNIVKFPKGSVLASSPKFRDNIGSYSVASHFGIRPQPCAVCSKYHNGVDVGTPWGTPLYAIALPGATVKVECFNTRLGGLTAIINSQSIPDRSFAAVHLSSCKAGTHKAGEIFARTGNSGAATTGPHLHWGESVNYQYVPPQRGYIEWVISSRIPQQFEPKAATFTVPTTVPASVSYGHFAYAEAPKNELVNVGNGEKLRRTAAVKFNAMVAAAGKKNITLVPLSGFRSIQEQRSVFYDTAAARGQSLEERAKVSAPPGYSEHHTGYAIDIGDGSHPELDFSPDLENTPAFRWMLVNAQTYGFELSFPRNNRQGVSYEPWHWRYVGDPQSQETFKAARVGN